jgi:predicted site-specific integrase-resolvase
MNENTKPTGNANGFDWIDAQQVMELLNIKPPTLKSWRSNGVIPYSNFGGKLFYNKSEILLQLERNKKQHQKPEKDKKKK